MIPDFGVVSVSMRTAHPFANDVGLDLAPHSAEAIRVVNQQSDVLSDFCLAHLFNHHRVISAPPVAAAG